MPSLSDTVTRLAAMRSGLGTSTLHSGADRLGELADFGSNPGALRARTYIPEELAAGAALVVVLHGCTQTAAGYDHGAGWSHLADRHGFALLFPEQQRQNNPNLCFNWFSPADARRGHGEALSIRHMVTAMLDQHPIDPARIYVTGLSAGGAMTSVMLAAYPELFAGGAIIAGLPFAAANSIPEALERMRGHGMPGEAELGALVRDASEHHGPWPTLSVWHGSGDATVNPSNAGAIIGQWRNLHGVQAEPTRRETVDGHPRRVWCNASGREVIEEYSISGLGHGTPLGTLGADPVGTAGPHMLEAGISSTRHIARFWGLIDEAVERTAAASVPVKWEHPFEESEAAQTAASPMTGGVTKVIEDALRAAGLMR